MHERPEDLDKELSRIARATAALRPSEGFSMRVRGAISAEREAVFRRAFVKAGRYVLATAAALAIATIAVAFELRSEANEANAISYGVVEELEW
jgi:hypothetical protein